MALSAEDGQLGVHTRPQASAETILRARAALEMPEGEALLVIDEYEWPPSEDERVSTVTITFGGRWIGRLAIGASARDRELPAIVDLVARELGGPLRVALLIETTQRLASHDLPTSALNRRAFLAHMHGCDANVVCLIDVDHFNLVNDRYGRRRR